MATYGAKRGRGYPATPKRAVHAGRDWGPSLCGRARIGETVKFPLIGPAITCKVCIRLIKVLIAKQGKRA